MDARKDYVKFGRTRQKCGNARNVSSAKGREEERDTWMLQKVPCASLFRRCRVGDSTSCDITGSIQVEWSLNCETWAQNSLNLFFRPPFSCP